MSRPAWHDSRWLPLFLLAPLFLVAVAPVAKGADATGALFVKKYCIACHSRDTTEGKVNLESFHDKPSLQLLFDVYDQTVLESMPPEDAEQPTAAERSGFVRVLDSALKDQGHDRKTQPGYGNYVDHDLLFTPNNLESASPRRVWRIDPSAMAEIGNKLVGKTVFRDKGQSVGKEHPSFTYRAPAHEFRDFDATSYFENTTAELALAYAKQIADYMEEYRFQPHQRLLDEADKLDTAQRREAVLNRVGPLDRVGATYRLLFDREIPESERQALAGLEPRWAVAALILKSDAVFRVEVDMNDYELARTLGFSLNETGPDRSLFEAVATRPLETVLDEQMKTDAFDRRLVRFLREYFEYDNAPNVFKDPNDQPKEVFKRGQQYHPIWHVEDADHFCLRIVQQDEAVLRQLLTSNLYSARGGLNSLHIKILGRGFQNGYRSGYHGVYGIAEENLPPWRADHEVPNRRGMLHHPAWLIAFSDNEKNQAIQRGRWITVKLLGAFDDFHRLDFDTNAIPRPFRWLIAGQLFDREVKSSCGNPDA